MRTIETATQAATPILLLSDQILCNTALAQIEFKKNVRPVKLNLDYENLPRENADFASLSQLITEKISGERLLIEGSPFVFAKDLNDSTVKKAIELINTLSSEPHCLKVSVLVEFSHLKKMEPSLLSEIKNSNLSFAIIFANRLSLKEHRELLQYEIPFIEKYYCIHSGNMDFIDLINLSDSTPNFFLFAEGPQNDLRFFNRFERDYFIRKNSHLAENFAVLQFFCVTKSEHELIFTELQPMTPADFGVIENFWLKYLVEYKTNQNFSMFDLLFQVGRPLTKRSIWKVGGFLFSIPVFMILSVLYLLKNMKEIGLPRAFGFVFHLFSEAIGKVRFILPRVRAVLYHLKCEAIGKIRYVIPPIQAALYHIYREAEGRIKNVLSTVFYGFFWRRFVLGFLYWKMLVPLWGKMPMLKSFLFHIKSEFFGIVKIFAFQFLYGTLWRNFVVGTLYYKVFIPARGKIPIIWSFVQHLLLELMGILQIFFFHFLYGIVWRKFIVGTLYWKSFRGVFMREIWPILIFPVMKIYWFAKYQWQTRVLNQDVIVSSKRSSK